MSSIPRVSVILPIYNVRRFLRKGFKQVMAQTYKDYEVLLIDDGATDGCAEICDELAAQHENVFAYHKPNGGLATARNMGFDKARGEFVYIYDVDDGISPRLLEYCVAQMDRTQAEIVMFSFRTIEVALGNRQTEVRLAPEMIESNEALKEAWSERLLYTPNGNGFVWNKFYRRDFLDRYHLRNNNLRIQQDEEFNLRVYRHLERVYISPEVLYDYYIYEKGNNRSRFIADRFDIYKAVYTAFRGLQHFWKLDDPRIDSYLYKRFWGNVQQCLIYNMHQPRCPWTKAERLKEFHRIASDDVTRETIAYQQTVPNGLEQRLYLHAIAKEQPALLTAASALFNRLRALKHAIRH